MNWKEIAAEIRRINAVNGWDAPTWESLPTKLMLVVTELDEAVGAEPWPEHMAEELADVGIRLLDVLQVLWPDWAVRDPHPADIDDRRMDRVEVVLWPIVSRLCMAVEEWRDDDEIDARISLEMAIRDLRSVAARLGIDLEAEIVAKLQKNAARGRLHGRARSDG